MNYRLLIKESWDFTQQNKRLIIWYGFLPSLLTTLVSIIYFSYQIVATLKSEYFAGEHGKSFLREVIENIIVFMKGNPDSGMTLLVLAIIIGILYLFLPTLFQAGLMQLVARMMNKQTVRIRDGITYGMFSFLPLFEYHLMIKTFGIVAIATEVAFILRNLGIDWVKTLFIPFLIFAIMGFVLTLLFTYSDYFIVIDEISVFSAILRSCKMVIFHWQETFLIIILMLFITVRIIVNIVLTLSIPALILFPAAYIATKTLAIFGVVIGVIIGIIALFFASYFNAILDVFKTTVWVKTFLYLTTHEPVSARELGETIEVRQANNDIE